MKKKNRNYGRKILHNHNASRIMQRKNNQSSWEVEGRGGEWAITYGLIIKNIYVVLAAVESAVRGARLNG